MRSQLGMVRFFPGEFSPGRDTAGVRGPVPGCRGPLVQRIAHRTKACHITCRYLGLLSQILAGLDLRREACTGSGHILQARAKSYESRQADAVNSCWKSNGNSRLVKVVKAWCFGYPRWMDRKPSDADIRIMASTVFPAACGHFMRDVAANHVLMAGFAGWFFAQFGKIFTSRYKTGIWDVRAFFDSGGMPSSHSSLCMAITTAVARSFGASSALFAMSLAFSVIVMYDAAGVRRHAGNQAKVLNILLTEIVEGHPISSQRLKEVLGHTPRQVLAGGILGVLVGIAFPMSGTPQAV
eukprot:jgi/Botrbrau1/14385/Bobra.0014s0034.2